MSDGHGQARTFVSNADGLLPVERVLDATAVLLISAGSEEIVGVQELGVHGVGLASGRSDDGYEDRRNDRYGYGVHRADRCESARDRANNFSNESVYFFFNNVLG